MKIPVSWIKEYIEYNVSNEKIAELLTMSGTEVSDIIKFGNEWDSNIIIGEIKKIDKHPNADRLSLVDVDNSQNIVKVVCGAPNIQVGQKIALAQPSAKLYNPYEKKISILKKSKIRGVESNGMICSALELNYYDDHEGILVLDPNFQTGESLHSLLADDIFDLGKDVFLNKAVCSTCHTLAEAGSNGQIGPNLNEIRPDKMRVMNAVTNGIGVMPAYEGQLTSEEIEAVAHYVSISAAN